MRAFYHLFRAKALRQIELGIVDIDRDHVKAHRDGVLHRHVTESADARYHQRIARLRFGHLQAFIDRHACAQHRRDLVEADIVGQVTDIVRIGEHIVREAAIDRIAGVELAFAQRLPTAQAVNAMAAGGVEPRHADPVTFFHVRHPRAHRGNEADALVAQDKRRLGLDRPVAFGGVQVGVAHARRLDRDLDHPGRDFGYRHFLDPQRGAEFAHDGCFHSLAHHISPDFHGFWCPATVAKRRPPGKQPQKKPSFFGL